MPKLNADQIMALMRTEFPAVQRMGFRIDALSDDAIALALPTSASDLRPGGTVSGPTMMTLVDTAAYFLVLANVGAELLAVTTSLDIHFLRKPAPGELVARGRLLKRGSRLVVAEVSVYSGGHDEPVAHAIVTYSVPPKPLR